MKYIEVLLIWCWFNFYMLFVAYMMDYPLTLFMTYFFAGVFLILIYGVFESIKEDKRIICRPY